MKPVAFTNNITVSSHLTLPSPNDQAMMLDTTVMHTAYGMAWLEQAPPAFTTSDYAVMPFSSQATSTHYRPGENLTAATDMLTTEINCWQPLTTKLPPASTYTFDNGHGCAVNVSFFQAHPYNNDTSIILYIGYHGSPILDYYLESPLCSKNSTNQFLTIFASRHMDEKLGSYETNMTALFCETSYHKQPVSVTVSAESGRPLNESLVPIGVKEHLTQDEFNSTAFSYLTGVGMPPDTPTATRDFPAATTFEPWGSLSKENVAGPTMPMVNLALGLSGELASDFQHAPVMERAFTLAHKTVFSAAISHLASETRENKQADGTSSYILNGVVVSRTISAVLECLLALLVFLMGGVLYTCMKAKSNLVSDPATIGFAFRSVRASRAVLNRLAMEDCSDNGTLQRNLAGEQFFLEQGTTGNVLEMESKADDAVNMADRRQNVQYDPVRPKESHPLTGCLLIAVLLAGAGVLIYFKKMEQKLQGLPRPSENFEVLQLLENYIPTALTTLLDPFLVLLTRLFCMLQPFNILRKGKCNPQHTLETKYTSLPPQLVLWRAVRSRDFLLSTLCLMALLVNVLTVALGGTFNELPVQLQYPTTFAEARTTTLSRDTLLDTTYMIRYVYHDHYYAASTNISHNTTLPPWVSTKYTFLPVNITSESPRSPDSYRATLRGFGVEPKCEAMATSPSSTSGSFANVTHLINGFTVEGTTFNFRRDDGTWQTCEPTDLNVGSNTTGLGAREVITPLTIPTDQSGSAASQDHICEDRFVAGWIRMDTKDPANTFRSTFLSCQAVLRTATFDVDFDKAGHILAYTQRGDFDDITSLMSRNMSQRLIRQANKLVNNSGRPFAIYAWHNTTLVSDWWNYLMKMYLNSTDLVDPSLDIPKPEAVIPTVEDLYRRLFAIVLGKNLDLFEEPAKPTDVPGIAIITETRIFLDDKAYLLSVIILCANAAVLMWAYLAQSDAYLPRLPSTLGSVLAYGAASRAIREYGDGINTDQEIWHNEDFYGTYSFGKYVGVDGNAHVGIEMDPFVTPINGTMLKRRASARLWFRKKEQEPHD
ncbi:hypothetical protein NEUTE1DRAFT_76069 [Neurospora tetrasperma FGSC 2508]|uniref:Uncharacterized protein n=1 Tax=Neurospora tetrasperma (strain FGSC 2508 / ATCC MYA-4615 / P0657) TaxID=510951 RepID=F8MDW2_NEUT8|nr:uncharacterized protein NEUTE1DRAFT_76069 [Neurospora tetrasperma FGSC 2508]EGO60699.1 hypothetical protein NEUTE1DRAFT_76069 [Neurospora tetrasperma FGSC 2508]EGZ75314.1 hypothetical protein NEUTE2DRAFT_104935 [Neurospora tetrasperma FGSC 2509]